MRSSALLWPLTVIVLAGSADVSFAQRGYYEPPGDGCGRDGYGRLVCREGARPGVPYYRQRRGVFSDGCGHDEYGRTVCGPGASPGVPYNPERAVGDGCGRDKYGRLVCKPGARPGVPYYGPD